MEIVKKSFKQKHMKGEKKIEKIYFTIAEVAEMLNVNQPTLRFWQDNFEWINPKRSKNNNRKYKKESIKELATIKFLLSIAGMTIEGVNKAKRLNYLEDLKDFHFKKQKFDLSPNRKRISDDKIQVYKVIDDETTPGGIIYKNIDDVVSHFQCWVENLSPGENFDFKVTSEEMTESKFEKFPEFV